MSSGKNLLTPYIKSLILDPPNLTPHDLLTVLEVIFRGLASEVQVGAFLTALRLRGLDQRPEYIAAAVTTILEFSDTIAAGDVHPDGYIDIVGTGGDGQNTFNVLTSSAIVAAGMGLPVCKHGGKALTSTSGSGDLLKCLGVDLMKVNLTTAPKIVEKSNFCYLFAPAFHPGMGAVASVRSQLGVPTIFNILGPLINPIPIRAQILGVYSEALGELYAQAVLQLQKLGRSYRNTMVVWGEVGLDEISPCGPTKCWIVQNETITRTTISPKDFGLPLHDLSQVKSGTPEENAEKLLHILRQDLPLYDIKFNNPLVDYILLNSAALAYVAGIANSFAHGVELAREAITSGAALAQLEAFKSAINSL